jgi:glycine/D-amino acid oxidase-like deaminating enzyme
MPTEVYQSIINCVDDSGPNDIITQNAVEHFAKVFPDGGWTADEEAKGLEYAWTGIIGMVCPHVATMNRTHFTQTPDALPFIGDIPEKKGQYVAAGYNGHGEFV